MYGLLQEGTPGRVMVHGNGHSLVAAVFLCGKEEV